MIPAPSNDLTGYFRPDFDIRDVPSLFPVVPSNIVDWDTSSVTLMQSIFAGYFDTINPFNLDIGNWGRLHHQSLA